MGTYLVYFMDYPEEGTLVEASSPDAAITQHLADCGTPEVDHDKLDAVEQGQQDMSNWQNSSERAVLVEFADNLRDLAHMMGDGKLRQARLRNADAITAALALADRAAEAERLLAEYVDSVDGGWGSDERLDLIRRVRAHRNAEQQEGQGDGD